MEDYQSQAFELVKAQAGVREMNEEEMKSMLLSLTNSLKEISEGGWGSLWLPNHLPEKEEKRCRKWNCGKEEKNNFFFVKKIPNKKEAAKTASFFCIRKKRKIRKMHNKL